MVKPRRGWTLVEALIVVLVTATLAAITVPRFAHAEGDPRLSALNATLMDMRAQLRLYWVQHERTWPVSERFTEQMTLLSRADGAVSPLREGAFALGPYLQSLPANPYTGGNSIGSAAPGTSDWFYDQNNGVFRANHDPAMVAY